MALWMGGDPHFQPATDADVARFMTDDRPAVATVYLSPYCPELRTRAWVEFLGFPPHLWSRRAANGCLVTFGSVTHLDAAELRRSGRMVAEARVTRAAAVPPRVNVMESVAVPGGGVGLGFVRHRVQLVVLSAEPVFEDEEEGRGRRKRRPAMPTDEQVGGGGGSSGFAPAGEHGDGEGRVSTEERPESVDCYLSSWTV